MRSGKVHRGGVPRAQISRMAIRLRDTDHPVGGIGEARRRTRARGWRSCALAAAGRDGRANSPALAISQQLTGAVTV
jgi:hypothetical protein